MDPMTQSAMGSIEVDLVRRFIARGDAEQLRASLDRPLELGAALEIACAVWAAGSTGLTEEVSAIVRGWIQTRPDLRAACEALAGAGTPVSRHATPPEEIAPIPAANDLLFLRQRFSQAVRVHGRAGRAFADALAGVFGEMADNALSHSAPAGLPPAKAVLAYRVSPGRMTFAVADVGQGVLRSLHALPVHRQSLKTERQALEAAVLRGATSRPDFGSGSGFPDLLRALADREGLLNFRSGDQRLLVDGRGARERRGRFLASIQLTGFQLSVSCQW